MTFAYQWQRCDSIGGRCVNVAGATGPSYVVSQSDYGLTIRVAVTATNPAGSALAVSPNTSVVSQQGNPHPS
jgi:hypothetical protein